MDPREVGRLLRIIQANGHQTVYDPRTRQELDAMGIQGFSESVLGAFKERTPDGKQEDICACTVILPGEMLTLPDNKTCPCAWGCGRTVQHRPWVTLPSVCLYCLAERKKDDN